MKRAAEGYRETALCKGHSVLTLWLLCAAAGGAASEEPATAAHFATSRRDTPNLAREDERRRGAFGLCMFMDNLSD
jgi:hypothetical protein